MHGLELKGKEKGREDENFAVNWLPLSLIGVIESIYYFMCSLTLTWQFSSMKLKFMYHLLGITVRQLHHLLCLFLRNTFDFLKHDFLASISVGFEPFEELRLKTREDAL
jgi:hypothetical protein